MPAYNAERFIAAAMRSVLAQHFRDFELLIINDGSTDRTEEIVRSFADPRVRLLNNQKNSGLVSVRNQGMREARGKYVALLDADDIALPGRLAAQKKFLDERGEYALVGSSVALIDEGGRRTGVVWKSRFAPDELPPALLFGNRFAQSSLMLRKSALPEAPYREGFAPAEDYELWLRLADGAKLANLSPVLTLYRVHGNSETALRRETQQKALAEIVRNRLARLGIEATPADLLFHRKNRAADPAAAPLFLAQKAAWLSRLIEANDRTGVYGAGIFTRVVRKIWLEACYGNSRAGLASWHAFWRSKLSEGARNESALRLATFFARCLLRKE